MDDNGEPSRVLYFPNMIVKVYSANISEEENKRRMKRIHDSAVELVKAAMRNKGKRL